MSYDLCDLLVEATLKGYTVYFEPGLTRDYTRVIVTKNGLRTMWEDNLHIFGTDELVMSKIKKLIQTLDECKAKERF